MSLPSTYTGDQLANALHALGVNFIMRGNNEEEILHDQPARLIAALAESNEARLRLSLIPLLLEHPEFSGHVRSAARNLDLPARLVLQCYYSAAVWLQALHRQQLDALIGMQPELPDLFSQELGLKFSTNPEKNLAILAERHQVLSGAQVNWLGTYLHAGQVWIKGLELQRP